MIVGLHLAEKVDDLARATYTPVLGVGEETAAAGAGENGGVVPVGGKDAVVVELPGVPDHLEKRAVARGAVDFPGGVEDLVVAVLGVGLGDKKLRQSAPRTPD